MRAQQSCGDICAWIGAKHAPLKLFSHQMDRAILRGAGVSLQFTADFPEKSCNNSKTQISVCFAAPCCQAALVKLLSVQTAAVW